MNYRLYENDDFDDLYAVEEVCFESSDRFTRRYMRELVTSSETVTWIAEEEGALAGFAIVEFIRHTAPTVAYISTIEVLPAQRGHGVGAELLRRLEGSANAERATGIWLHVDMENASAIRLYERLGYQKNSRANHYYARNRPASIYVKRLA